MPEEIPLLKDKPEATAELKELSLRLWDRSPFQTNVSGTRENQPAQNSQKRGLPAARDRVSVENVMSFRTGAAASNRFVRCSRSSRIGEALFENPARVSDRNRENEVKDAEEEIAFDELQIGGADLPHRLRELHDGNH